MEQQLQIRLNVSIPMRDGIRLRCNIYGPDDEKACPAVLVRMPYSKDVFEYEWGWLNPLPIARAGYRVVVQDVRGTGESEGTMDFDKICQLQDGYDTVEWIAAQEWCDGSVGMYGLSYYGFTQLLAAEGKPPHLKTICPWQQSGLPKYAGGFTTGPIYLAWLLERARDWLASGRCTLKGVQRKEAIEQVNYYLTHIDEMAGYSPQVQNPAAKIKGVPILEDYLRRIREYDDPACPAREGRPIDFSGIDLPCFFLGGWYDDSSKDGPIENWLQIKKLSDGTERLKNCKMVMGPWIHGGIFSKSVGCRDFGDTAARPMGKSITEHLIEWFDYWLKGVDNGLSEEPAVTVFAMGRNEWRYESQWPIESVKYKKLYLSSGGNAGRDREGGRLLVATEEEGKDTYLDDPANPVPSRVPGISSECQEQTPLELREDVLVYTSQVLSSDLEVAGAAVAELYISSDCPDADFMVKITEVTPDGASVNITDGAVRASYNNTYERKLLKSGEIKKVTVYLGNTCNVFRKGNRLRLIIAGSSFPKYDVNPHTADRIGTAVKQKAAHNSVYFGEKFPSCIILPVVPGETEKNGD